MKAADILHSLEEARRAVAAGDLVDLGGLEKAVEVFCGEAATAAPTDRETAAAELAAVRDALDQLAGEIDASKTRIATDAQDRHQAIKAYRPRKS